MSLQLSEDHNDAVVLRASDGDRSKELCDRVGRSVRGLTELLGDTLPHLTSDVAGCTHQIDTDDDVDNDALQQLRDEETINWCRTARRLVPLSVGGYGRSLDVACSVALWGISDLAALLRRIIYVSLLEFGVDKFRQRWHRCCANDRDIGSQSDQDWDRLVKLSQPRQDHLCSDAIVDSDFEVVPLSDPLQVFVLANILRRPIVILSKQPKNDRACENSQQNISNVSGIYLPLLWEPEECIKFPLVLAYVGRSFVPLVPHSTQLGMPTALDIVPIVTSQLEPLRIWFLLETEELDVYELEQRYLSMTEVNLTRASSFVMVLGARLKFGRLDNTNSCPERNTTPVLRPPVGETQPLSFRNVSSGSVNPLHLPHELVSVERTSIRSALQPGATDLSIADTPCREHGCVNYASWFVYPYCYEHIDRRIVESTIAQNSHRPLASLPEPSMVIASCQHPGCRNLSSRFIYPYCYEHIEVRIANATVSRTPDDDEYLVSVAGESCVYPHCPNQASIYTYPVCYEHLDFFASPSLPRPMAESVQRPAESAETRYTEVMAEVESRVRGALRCKSPWCGNYGNNQCNGLCHECFRNTYTRHISVTEN